MSAMSALTFLVIVKLLQLKANYDIDCILRVCEYTYVIL